MILCRHLSSNLRVKPLSQAPVEISAHGKKQGYIYLLIFLEVLYHYTVRAYRYGTRTRPGRAAGLGTLKRTKTATAPVLMKQAYF